MKKKSLLLVVLALVVLSALVIGCKNETPLPSSVTFTTGPVATDGNMKIEFKSGGTTLYYESDSGAWTGGISCTVTYSVAVMNLSIGGGGSPINCYTDSTKAKGFASYKDLANASSFFADKSSGITFNKE